VAYTLFVSDLHLDPERPAVSELFLDFLARRAGQADAVYILGDLFEAWIGDDDLSALNQAVCEGLADCAVAGSPVFVMRGNRDFLLGEQFARRAGCTLLDDQLVIDLYGTPTLLMHGDQLCTDDAEYMKFRDMVRDTAWQSALLARSLEERREIARDMRRVSREQTSGKPEAITDVNAQAVIDVMARHDVRRLIHGHTHRPGFHDLVINGDPAQRIVLGDWYEQGSLLECNPQGCRLQALSLPQH
jgi:UDP-2,3-diacylglucosamine hydrolase